MEDGKKVGMVAGLLIGGVIGLMTGGIGIAAMGTAIGVKGVVAGATLGAGTGYIVGNELDGEGEEDE